jgi:hypothetical protein
MAVKSEGRLRQVRRLALATTINAELAEPAEKTISVLRALRFLR